MRTYRRQAAISIVAVMLAAATGNPATAQQSPFRGLYTTPDVTTSNDEYQVWVHWTATQGTLTLPGEPRALRVPDDTRDVWLSVTCRADGTGEEYLHGTAPDATLLLPHHPDTPPVPTILSPWFWLRALTGNGTRRTPISIRWNDKEPGTGTLIEPRISYSVPRPGLEVSVDPDKALAALESTQPTQLEASGQRTRITLQFEPRPKLREIGALMSQNCPSTSEDR